LCADSVNCIAIIVTLSVRKLPVQVQVGRNVQSYHQTVNCLFLLPCSPSLYIVLYFSLCVSV